MDVFNHIKANPEIEKKLQSYTRFVCDFETTTKPKLNKYGKPTSKIYLWGIANRKGFFWGTELNDFWAVIELLAFNDQKARTKKFYFVNLSFDYQFLKTTIHKKYELYDGDYIEFLKLKTALEKKEICLKSKKGLYYMIMSGSNVIALTIIKNGRTIEISCLYRKTSLSVEKMGVSLRKNNIEAPQKLKEKFDYHLIQRVYKRNRLFKKVYGESMNEKNFWKNDLGIEGEFKYVIKYLKNDCLIPFLYLKYFGEKLDAINLKLNETEFYFKQNKKLIGVGKELDHQLIEKRREVIGEKKNWKRDKKKPRVLQS